VAESFGAKEKGHCKVSEFFGDFLVDFCSVWSGLGPNHNYFLGNIGPCCNFPIAQGSWVKLQ
jgi:hypothetical protein